MVIDFGALARRRSGYCYRQTVRRVSGETIPDQLCTGNRQAMMQSRQVSYRSGAAACATALSLCACAPQHSDAGASTSTTSPQHSMASAPIASSKNLYSLGIVGYNYTEVGIFDYSVNGRGAFNLSVSTEDSGGGKTACCFGWAPATKLPLQVKVEWTRDETTWCRQTVAFSGPIAPEPTTLEVHIYPDRHVEVAITDTYSPPRLKLPGTGGNYRVGKDVRAEKLAAIRKDQELAECRQGRFPISSVNEAGKR